MGKKMKLPFFFKTPESTTTTTSWPWPSCTTTKTLSFRATTTATTYATAHGGDIFKTINSAYAGITDSGSRRIDESSTTAAAGGGGESIEAVINGLRSAERLFFSPGETSSSIMEEAKSDGFIFKESVVMAMESINPYADFKRSMAEMVVAHGLMNKDWDSLEELLSWYFRVNDESNHGYIVGAFVDLLVDLAFASSSSSSSSSSTSTTTSVLSPISPLSFSCSSSTISPCLSLLEEAEDEIEKREDNGSSSSSSSS
ncbi:transcription repressor OFP15-like [Camellia sinensis]|uniref:transcription repressor OFP15-like n=1 Tax=Camellia sinensis TaxID=4442 RepID=UPI0010360372|nr:transcription repressor OFP15-like [Camellia sinensis]